MFSGRIIIPRTSLDVWFGLLIFTCPQLKICSATQATTRFILAEQRFLTKQCWISDHLGSPISGYSLIHKKDCFLIDYMQCLRKHRLFYRLALSLTSWLLVKKTVSCKSKQCYFNFKLRGLQKVITIVIKKIYIKFLITDIK